MYVQLSIPTTIVNIGVNTFKYHIFAPMGRFQLELIYLYFPLSSHVIYMYGTTVENIGKLIPPINML